MQVEDGGVLAKIKEKDLLEKDDIAIRLRCGGQDVPIRANAYGVPNNNKPPVCSRSKHEGRKKFPIYEGLSAGYGGDDSDPGDFSEQDYNPYTTDRLSHQEERLASKITNGETYLGFDENRKGVKVYLDELRTKAYHIRTLVTDEELAEMGVDVNKVREYENGYKYDITKTPQKNQEAQEAWEKERDSYFQNPENMPKEALQLYAKRMIDFCKQKSEKGIFVKCEGAMGRDERPEPGTLFIDLKERIVIFRHRDYSAKVSVKLSRAAFRRLIYGDENGDYKLVLFPGAHKR